MPTVSVATAQLVVTLASASARSVASSADLLQMLRQSQTDHYDNNYPYSCHSYFLQASCLVCRHWQLVKQPWQNLSETSGFLIVFCGLQAAQRLTSNPFPRLAVADPKTYQPLQGSDATDAGILAVAFPLVLQLGCQKHTNNFYKAKPPGLRSAGCCHRRRFRCLRNGGSAHMARFDT